MQIHELPTISGSPSGGYFATDNGTQTTKIDYTALAQAIIEQYNASTLAGSAQSVKAALDGLDGDKLDLKAGTAITSGTDVNTLQTPGTYFCSSASIAASLSNIPSQATAVGFRLDVARNGYNTDNYLTQTLVGVIYGLSTEYVRGMSVQGTWGEWQKAPTRAEVDALTPTEITGITSAYGTVDAKCYKMGKVVVLAARLTVTSDISANQDVITGIPVMATVTNYTPVPVWDDTSKTSLTLAIKRNASSGNNGAFYTRSAIASGASIRISTAYCAQN